MAPTSTLTVATTTAVVLTTPTPFIIGTSITILALLIAILILLAIVLRLQALQLRRTHDPVQSPPPVVARVPVFFAAPGRSSNEPRIGGNRKEKKKGNGDKGASRRTSTDGEIEEVELNVLEYGRGGGVSIGLGGNAL